MTADSDPSKKEEAEQEKAAASAAGSPGQTPRESMLGGVVSSVKYLQEAHAEVDVIKLRKSDKFTHVMLWIGLGVMVAAMFLPVPRSVSLILADVLISIVLLAFLGLRFGVVRTLKPRQAVLTWQLILGSFLLGIYAAFNILMAVLLRNGVHID